MIPCRLCGAPAHSREVCVRCYQRTQDNGTLDAVAAPPFAAGRGRDASAKTVERVMKATRRHARKATPAERTAAARAYLRGEGTLRAIGASIGVSEGRMSQIVAEELAREEAP